MYVCVCIVEVCVCICVCACACACVCVHSMWLATTPGLIIHWLLGCMTYLLNVGLYTVPQ